MSDLKVPILAMAVGLINGPVAGQCQYEVTLIEAPFGCGIGFLGLQPAAINDLGNVAGWWTCPGNDVSYPFIWTPEESFQSLPLPLPGAEFLVVSDINNDNAISGWFEHPEPGLTRIGFVYEDGEYTLFDNPPPGGTFTEPYAMSNSGIAVGWAHLGTEGAHAFLWNEAREIDIGLDLDSNASRAEDINATGTVTGWRIIGGTVDRTGFLWKEGQVTFLSKFEDWASTMPFAINLNGTVVGSGDVWIENELVVRAFSFSSGRITNLGVLDRTDNSVALGVNDAGVVLGAYNTGPGQFRPLIWLSGEPHDLAPLVTNLEGMLRTPRGINAAGEIITDYVGDKTAVALLRPLDPPVADLTGDCAVGVPDLLKLLGEWNAEDSIADLDSSGTVGIGDLLLLLSEWSSSC